MHTSRDRRNIKCGARVRSKINGSEIRIDSFVHRIDRIVVDLIGDLPLILHTLLPI